MRNLGVPLGHSVIAMNATRKGLGKLVLNGDKIAADLEANWAIVAEAIQTILRREAYPEPYEALKALTRTNGTINQEVMREFVEGLDVSDAVKAELNAITPANYLGFASDLSADEVRLDPDSFDSSPARPSAVGGGAPCVERRAVFVHVFVCGAVFAHSVWGSAQCGFPEGVLAWISLGFDGFVQREGASVALAVLCGAMVVLALLKNAVQYAALYVMAGIRTGVSRDLRQDLYGKLMSMPMAWFSESKRGDVMSRFTHDLMEVEHSVIGSLEALLKAPLMIVVSLATLVALSWKLTLFAFVLLPVTGALISRWSKRLKRHAQLGKEELGQLVSVLEETLLGMRIVKAFNAEAQFTEAYGARNHGHFKAMRRMHRRESMSSPMSEVISLSVMALLLAFGGSLVLSGDSALSGDWFIGYLVVFSQIIPPARSLSDGYFRVSRAWPRWTD